MHNRGLKQLVALSILLSVMMARGSVYFVDGDAGDDTRTGTGGWSDALKTITNALTKASTGSEIWVKSGVYKPSVDDREKSFTMKNGVDLYGGFAGTESSREQRDWDANPTVLSGEIGDPGIMNDNSRHVVLGATARLDGFTVCDGYAMYYKANPDARKQGAGMYTSGAFPVVANCVFSNNITEYGNGGGVYWYQGSYISGTSGWYNCVFERNITTNSWSSGGGMYLRFLTNVVGTGSNCVFRGNIGAQGSTASAALHLEDAGGRLWPEGSAFKIQNCVFSNNPSWNNIGGVSVTGFKVPVMIEDCLFVANTNYAGASYGGGAALNISVPADGQGPQVSRCLFLQNYTAQNGAAVHFGTGGGGTNSVWRDCQFIGNRAQDGGALYGAIDGTFVSCIFSNNTSTTGYGSAVWSDYAGRMRVDCYTNCQFIGNAATHYCGAVRLHAPADFRDCIFLNNTCASGTGVGGAINWSVTVAGETLAGRVSDCIFEGNNGGGDGGAIALNNVGELLIERSRFVGNKGTGSGGAIYSAAGLAPFATDCHFVSNTIGTAKAFGGAWYARGPAHIERCVFDGNRATSGRGGALCVRDVTTATGAVVNCVFRDNTGYYGGAIATSNAHLRLSHVTAYTNASLNAAHGGALSHAGTGTPLDGMVDNSIFWGNGAAEILPAEGVVCRYSDVAGGFAGEGNLDPDPRFADTRYLHLSSKTGVYADGYFTGGAWQVSPAHSPLIDAGDPVAAWSLEPVPNNGRVNMGAYGNTRVASLSLRGGTVLMVK